MFVCVMEMSGYFFFFGKPLPHMISDIDATGFSIRHHLGFALTRLRTFLSSGGGGGGL